MINILNNTEVINYVLYIIISKKLSSKNEEKVQKNNIMKNKIIY